MKDVDKRYAEALVQAFIKNWSWREAIYQDHKLMWGEDHTCDECVNFPQVPTIQETVKTLKEKYYG